MERDIYTLMMLICKFIVNRDFEINYELVEQVARPNKKEKFSVGKLMYEIIWNKRSNESDK